MGARTKWMSLLFAAGLIVWSGWAGEKSEKGDKADKKQAPAAATADPQTPAPQSPAAISDPRVTIEPRTRTPATEPAIERRRSNIRVDTNVVLIPVTVTDPLNRFVTGLEKEHFKLTEDNVEQQVSVFSSEDAALSIGLVFDASGSMGNKLQKSRQAAASS